MESMPLYTSTRGGAAAVTWEEAIVSGYAPDGGLYVPAEVPQVGLAAVAVEQSFVCLWLSCEFLIREVLGSNLGAE